MRRDIIADPFCEHRKPRYRRRVQILGVRFDVTSNDAALLHLFDDAFARLPRPARALGRSPRPRVQLALRISNEPRFGNEPGVGNRSKSRLRAAARTRASGHEIRADDPPRLVLSSGAGLLTGRLGDSGIAILAPDAGSGLVQVARSLLGHPYHVRYELLEFAVYTLAARIRGLSSLHGACVGHAGRAVLLLGDSGAGKSTLAAQSLLDGLELLGEDSVFVESSTMSAMGVPNYLHLQEESLPLLEPQVYALPLAGARVITRRSGARKLEIDLRSREPEPKPGNAIRPASGPAKLAAIVLLSAKPSPDERALRPLSRAALRAQLSATQAYAASQPHWPRFLQAALRLPAYELRRTSHPRVASNRLRTLLCASR